MERVGQISPLYSILDHALQGSGNIYEVRMFEDIKYVLVLNSLVLYIVLISDKPQFSTDVQRVYSVREGQDLTVELTATGNPNIIKYSWHNSIVSILCLEFCAKLYF